MISYHSLKRRFLSGSLTVILALAAPLAVSAETLADAMADAYKNSGLLDQNRALLRAADEDVAVALSGLRPIINWAADVTDSFGKSFNTATMLVPRNSSATEATIGLTLELLLYDAGATRLRIEAAKETVLATREALVAVEQNVLLQAVQAYMDVRSNLETVALRQNNVRVIGEELRAAQDRFEVGEVTRTDVALTEARLAGARAALAQAQGDLQVAREFFTAAVGRKPGSLAVPPKLPSPARDLASAKAIAVKTHPDIRQIQHRVAVNELNVRIAGAAMKPRVTLEGRYGVTDESGSANFSRGGSIGLNLRQPIYQGGKLSALQRQAMARRDAERANLHVASIKVEQNVGTAYARVQVARAALASSNEQIRAARVAFRGVREEATLGARTTLDVLNAEQELLNAQASQITANSNEYVAAFSLLASMGKLTADQLNLKVQRYDPTAYYNMVKDAPHLHSDEGQKLDRVLRSIGKK